MLAMWKYLLTVSILSFAFCVDLSACTSIRGDIDDVSQTGSHDTRAIFYITRVTREDEGDSCKVTLEYQASRKPTATLLRVASRLSPISLEDQKPGQLTVNIPKTPTLMADSIHFYPPHAHVHFMFPHVTYIASLDLDFNDSMQVPRTTLRVEPGSDVTFSPGSDVTLNLTLTVEDDLEDVEGEHVRFQFTVMGDEEEGTLHRYASHIHDGPSEDRPVWMELVTHSGDKGDRRATLAVNSTREDPEGVVDLIDVVSFNCSRNCLLYEFITVVSVKFYRQDHPGPFPEGFLGFVRNENTRDPSRKYCNVDPTDRFGCFVACEAAGDEPSTTEISRILPNGDVIATDDVRLSGEYWSSAQLGVDEGSAGDAYEFRCTARSGSKEITRDVLLTLVKPARFDRDLSRVTRYENGSVAGTCVAHGIPAPNVTFLTDNYSMSGVYPQHYDITVTQVDESTTRADIIITDPEAASDVYMFECYARNDQNDMYWVNDYISIHEGAENGAYMSYPN